MCQELPFYLVRIAFVVFLRPYLPNSHENTGLGTPLSTDTYKFLTFLRSPGDQDRPSSHRRYLAELIALLRSWSSSSTIFFSSHPGLSDYPADPSARDKSNSWNNQKKTRFEDHPCRKNPNAIAAEISSLRKVNRWIEDKVGRLALCSNMG